jgi:hypothetical protein
MGWTKDNKRPNFRSSQPLAGLGRILWGKGVRSYELLLEDIAVNNRFSDGLYWETKIRIGYYMTKYALAWTLLYAMFGKLSIN